MDFNGVIRCKKQEYKQVKLTASPSSSQAEMPYLWQYICVEPAGNNQAIIERSISQRIF